MISKIKEGLQAIVLGASLAAGGLFSAEAEAPRPVTPEELRVRENREYIPEQRERAVEISNKEETEKIDKAMEVVYKSSAEKSDEDNKFAEKLLNKKVKESFELEAMCYFGKEYNDPTSEKPNHSEEDYGKDNIPIVTIFPCAPPVNKHNLLLGEKINLGVRLNKERNETKFDSKFIDLNNLGILEVKPKVENNGNEIRHVYEPLKDGVYLIGWCADAEPCEFYRLSVGRREVKRKDIKNKPKGGLFHIDLDFGEEGGFQFGRAIAFSNIYILRNEGSRAIGALQVLSLNPGVNCFEDITWKDVISLNDKLPIFNSGSNSEKERQKLEKMCYFGKNYNRDKTGVEYFGDRMNNIQIGEKIMAGVRLEKGYERERFTSRIVNFEKLRALDIKPIIEKKDREIKHIYEPLEEGTYVFTWLADGRFCEKYTISVGEPKSLLDITNKAKEAKK